MKAGFTGDEAIAAETSGRFEKLPSTAAGHRHPLNRAPRIANAMQTRETQQLLHTVGKFAQRDTGDKPSVAPGTQARLVLNQWRHID